MLMFVIEFENGIKLICLLECMRESPQLVVGHRKRRLSQESWVLLRFIYWELINIIILF